VRRTVNCVADIFRAGDKVARDGAGVARPLRGVSGRLSHRATLEPAARACLHRRALRRRLPSVLRREDQLHSPRHLYHAGPRRDPPIQRINFTWIASNQSHRTTAQHQESN